MILAVMSGDSSKVEAVAQRCAQLINVREERGKTALICAVELEDELMAADMVELLLCIDEIDTGVTDHGGRNALHYAARKRNIGACRWLAARVNGGVFVRCNEGMTPRDYATKFGGHDGEVAELLRVWEYRVKESSSITMLANPRR